MTARRHLRAPADELGSLGRAACWCTLACLVSLDALAGPPRITHQSPRRWSGREIVLHARITAAGGVYEARVFWRRAGEHDFRQSILSADGSRDQFTATLSAGDASAVEYYLSAFDTAELSEGRWQSPDQPALLERVAPEQAVLPTLEISGGTLGSVLSVDGARVGTVRDHPTMLTVHAGHRRVVASREGCRPVSVEIDVSTAGVTTLSLPACAALTPVPTPAPLSGESAAASTMAAAPTPLLVPLGPPTGHLRVMVEPPLPQAMILIDGAGATPAPFDGMLPAGDHRVSVMAPGFADTPPRLVSVQPGADQTLALAPGASLARQPEEPSPPVPPVDLSPVPPSGHETSALASPQLTAPSKGGSPMERTAGQVLATLGAVILAAGGGTAIAAGATYAGLSSSPTGHNGTSDYVSIGRINNEATATVVIAPVGLALTVAGIILLTRSP